MICTSCGLNNPEGMNFCGRCSTPLSYLPTGVITYLFTDLEGSTQLWQQYPDQMSGVLTRHDSLITSVVEEHGGMVVRSRGEGDSLFAVFVRARDATSAAWAVQMAILIHPGVGEYDGCNNPSYLSPRLGAHRDRPNHSTSRFSRLRCLYRSRTSSGTS